MIYKSNWLSLSHSLPDTWLLSHGGGGWKFPQKLIIGGGEVTQFFFGTNVIKK